MDTPNTVQPSREPSWGERFFWFICSIRFTVFLLVSLAAILAGATFFESSHGTGAVQMNVYRAVWFNVFLFAFTLNMLGGTYKRFRPLWVHLGFAITHIGVFTILLGAFLTRNCGFEGQMTIPEGATRDYFIGNDDKLTIEVGGGEDRLSFTVPIDRGSKQRDVWVAEKLRKARITAVLDRYYPDLEFDQEVEPGGPVENPAVQFKLSAMGSDAGGWLLSRVAGRDRTELGPLAVDFAEGPVPPAAAPSAASTGPNVLVLSSPDGKDSNEVPAVAGKSVRLKLGGKDLTVTVKQAFVNFTMDGKDFRDREGPPDNPAVAFVVDGPDGHSPDIAFSKYPDFSLQHGKTNTRYKARYEFRGAAAEPKAGNRLSLFWSGGKLGYVLRLGSKPAVTGALPVGKAVELLDGRITFTIIRAVKNARLAQGATNGSDEARNPAIHVKLVPFDGQEGAGVWIPWGESREVEVAGKRVTLLYRGDKYDLPFAIGLNKFKEDKYPGTNQPATYESHIHLKDREQGRSGDLTISMNEPLLYRGYTFFQSSYIPGEGGAYTTILSVSHDPGKWPTYIGYLLTVFGCIVMFYLKPYLARWDQARLKKEKAR